MSPPATGASSARSNPGTTSRCSRAARAEVGPDVVLAADANGSYALDDARAPVRARSTTSRLQCVEQPCAPDALARPRHARRRGAHADLPRRDDHGRSTPRTTRSRAARADVIAIKVGRLGIAGAQRVHDDVRASGVARARRAACWRPVSAGPRCSPSPRSRVHTDRRLLGLGPLLRRRRRHHRTVRPRRRRLRVPTGPGLGVEPLPDRLARCTVAHDRITPRLGGAVCRAAGLRA